MKVYGMGINDMPGFRTTNEREYKLWVRMLERCYSEQWHLRHPSYKECEVCDEWLFLSKFIQDISQIDGYEEWIKKDTRYDLDKDSIIPGNKTYSLSTVRFIPQSENIREMLSRTGNLGGFSNNGYNESKAYRVVVYNLKGEKVGEYNSNKECSEALRLDPSAITKCINGKQKYTKGFIIMKEED